MIYEEKTITSERIYEGKILNLRKDRVLAVGEQEAYREIVEHNGGVTIAAITDEGKMLMVRNIEKQRESCFRGPPQGRKEKVRTR